MSVDWGQTAKSYFDELPHPKAPNLKIKDFVTAIKLATAIKFGGHASAAEAALFWSEFQASGMAVGEFEHAVERIAPLSYTYHGRPPTMQEIAQLKDKLPGETRRYFADLPDKHYPHVSAGDMIKALQAAEPHAREHLGRPALKNEAAYLHHSGERPADYYLRLAADRDAKSQEGAKLAGENVVSPAFGGNQGGRGPRTPGGSTPEQRDPYRQWSGVSQEREAGATRQVGG